MIALVKAFTLRNAELVQGADPRHCLVVATKVTTNDTLRKSNAEVSMYVTETVEFPLEIVAAVLNPNNATFLCVFARSKVGHDEIEQRSVQFGRPGDAVSGEVRPRDEHRTPGRILVRQNLKKSVVQQIDFFGR